MQRYILLFSIIFLPLFMFQGHAGTGFYYQAVLRNSDGTLMDIQLVAIKINIRSNTPDGTIVYSEVHVENTNPFGIVNLLISSGAIVEGSYEQIQWGSNTYYLELIVDNTNSNNYNNSLGATQIVSVPVANYAYEAGNVNYNDTIADNELQQLYIENDSIKLSNASGGVPIHAGLWTSNGDDISITDKWLALGVNESYHHHDLSANKTNLTIRNHQDAAINSSSHVGIHSFFTGDSRALRGESECRIGYLGAWDDNGSISGVEGIVKNLNYIDRTNSDGYALAAGGRFMLNMSDMSFGLASSRYILSGVTGHVHGNLSEYPNSSVISGLYGLDDVATDSSYAGYFDGKCYIRDHTGIGIKNPQRSLHIKDVMRLEPRSGEPLDPRKGDLYFDDDTNKLRIYDGTAWQNVAFE